MNLKVYLSEEQIQKRIAELAVEIEKFIGDDDAVLIANLKGSVLFFADLIRKIKSHKITTDFLSTESYAGMETTGNVKITRDLSGSIDNKKVILIEDILDTGLTLEHILRYIRDIHNPQSVKICVLLDKPANRRTEIKPDFTGFVIENEFVVGYGLDYNETLRNLPYIAILEQ